MYKISKLFLSTILLTGFVFFSCSDDEDTVPFVERVRLVTQDSTIAAADFDMFVVLQGKGFGKVSEVRFNGITANLNLNYVTFSNIIVQVPDEFPEEVGDIVTLVNADGSQYDFSFRIDVPLPAVDEFNYIAATNQVIVNGGNFVHMKSLSIDGTEVVDFDVSSGMDQITFQLPEGVLAGVIPVELTSAAGTSMVDFDLEAAARPIITNVPLEWGEEGSTMRIEGRNLARINKVTINGTFEVTDGFESDEIFSWLEFPMPADVPGEEITIQAINELLSTSNAFTSKYKSSTLLWWNYDDIDYSWGADKATRRSVDKVPPVSDFYGFWEGTISPSWWDQGNMYNGDFAIPDEILNNPNNFAVKFELNVVNEWSAGVFTIAFKGDDNDEQFSYAYKPYQDGESFVTEGWITVTIPLSEWNISGTTTLANPRFKFFIPGDATEPALETAIYIDNIRIDAL